LNRGLYPIAVSLVLSGALMSYGLNMSAVVSVEGGPLRGPVIGSESHEELMNGVDIVGYFVISMCIEIHKAA
jgi:hypothetical protein